MDTKQLTAEDIDAMEAGPEMDALVAERVMGWRWLPIWNGRLLLWPDGGFPGAVLPSSDDVTELPDGRALPWQTPEFSRDIAAAWQVVEHTHVFDDGAITEHLKSEFVDGHWQTERGWAVMEYMPRFGETVGEVVAWAPTAPLAICRAALKAALTR